MSENIKERYVDGIGKIHFIGGMIRFDLYSFQPSEEITDEDEKKDTTPPPPTPIIAERLIMSPNGFLASYDAMVNMINRLTEAGVISKREADEREGEPIVETPTAEMTAKYKLRNY